MRIYERDPESQKQHVLAVLERALADFVRLRSSVAQLMAQLVEKEQYSVIDLYLGGRRSPPRRDLCSAPVDEFVTEERRSPKRFASPGWLGRSDSGV
jgi:hypothetical protein